MRFLRQMIVGLSFIQAFHGFSVREEGIDLGQTQQTQHLKQAAWNAKTLEGIKTRMDDGEKPWVLIGRMAEQSLPENPEKGFWVSGAPEAFETVVGENRLHLLGDFLDEGFLMPLHNTFSGVVVDASTWKFLINGPKDPAFLFSKLLSKGQDSTFIFECSPCGIESFLRDDHSKYYWYLFEDSPTERSLVASFEGLSPQQQQAVKEEIAEKWTLEGCPSEPEEFGAGDYAGFMMEQNPAFMAAHLAHQDAILQGMRDRCIANLKTLFHEVAYVDKGDFYQKLNPNYPGLQSYYVCKHPK